MADTTDDVGIRLIVDGQEIWSSKIDKASSSIAKMRAEAERHQATLKASAKDLDGFAESIDSFGSNILGAFSNAGSAIDGFTSQFSTIGGMASSVLGPVVTGAALVTAGLTAATGAATYFGLKTYNSIEQANAAFGTLLGSADKGKAFTAQLREMANVTPFTFENIMPSAEMMLNSGDDPTKALKDITAIGNAASAANPQDVNGAVSRISLAIEQIRQEPALTADNMRQLEAANVNPYGLLATASGRSVGDIRKAASAGKISGSEAADTLLAQFQTNYGGAMDAQQKTLSGNLSTLHDVIGGDLATAVTPLALLLERDMPTITNDLGHLATSWGHMLDTTIQDGQLLWQAWKSGGMHGVLTELGSLTGTGSTFATFWSHFSTDSINIAKIWENSLYPAIRDVAKEVGPFVGILGPFLMDGKYRIYALLLATAMGDLSVPLKWMADHPTVTKDLMLGLVIGFETYKITSLVIGLTTAFGDLLLKLPLVQAAMAETGTVAMASGAEFQVMGAEAEAAYGAGVFGAGGLKTAAGAGLIGLGGYEGYENLQKPTSSGGFLKTVGSGAAGGAGIGLLGGPFDEISVPAGAAIGATGAAAIYGLKALFGGSSKPTPQATGGTTVRAGLSLVGENGPEILSMQPGATVIPLDRAGDASSRVSVVFQDGAIRLEAADYLDGDKLGQTLVQVIQSQIARQ